MCAKVINILSNSGLSSVDLGYIASPIDGIITNTGGEDATIPLADSTNAGLLSPGDFDIIQNIETEIQDIITQVISDGDTNHAPSSDAVYDALVDLETSISDILVQSVTDGDTTHAPSADAVFDFISTSVIKYAKLVYTNTSDPNTSTIFSTINPPTVNDDLLKADSNNLYIGAGVTPSSWIYNTTPVPAYYPQSLAGTNLISSSIPVVLSAGNTLGKYKGTTSIPSTGWTFEQLMKDIALEYVKPSFTSVTLTASPNTTPVEVGEILSTLSITFVSVNDSLGNPPINRFITGDGFNRNIMAETSPYLGVGTSTSNAPVTKTWVLSGTDANNVAITSVQTSRAWLWRSFFGASAAVITGANINTMQQNSLLAGKGVTRTCAAYNNDPLQNTYIIYPASFGDLSNIIMNGALSVLSSFTKQADVSYTNVLGVVVSMRIYKSNSTGAFAAGTTLLIS